MKKRFSSALALIVLSWFACLPLFAHHGEAAFSSGNKITMKATVTDWYWANPHCILQFDVKGDDGQVVHWAAETSAPASMINAGWTKRSLKPGDQVTITVEPVKNGRPLGRVLEVVFPSGQKVTGGFSSQLKE